MFLTLRSTATSDFFFFFMRADFARLAFMLLLAPLVTEEDCLPVPSLQITTSNRIHGASDKNLNKNAAHIHHSHWNNSKMRQMDQVKMTLSRHPTRETELAVKVIFSA